MDIFNKKKVARLEYELDRAIEKNNNLHNENNILKMKLEQIGSVAEKLPEDCVKGPWCQACDFSKTFHYTDYYAGPLRTGYICGKSESCKNFVQKEVK